MLEKSNDEYREKHNNLLIQKDLLENEMKNLKTSIENEKNSNISLINRLNESEGTFQKNTLIINYLQLNSIIRVS
jgi:hypothetical protein